MQETQDALKTLKLWQVGVLVAVLMGAAGVTYGVYALVSGSGGSGLAENQQLIPVQYGNLVNQVSTNGSIIFPNRETLTFDTQGTVGDVLVEEGQRVEEGQALARLDETTTASLEKVVAQANINLKNAEDALEKAKDPHTPLDMAQAETAVTNAKLTLEKSQDGLVSLLEPSSQNIAQAEAKVANARLTLENAGEGLDRLLEPEAQDMVQAEVKAANARLTLENAREVLDMLLEPGAQEVAQAEARLASAKLTLADAQDALNGLLEPTLQEIAQAEAKVTNAKLSVEDAQEALETVKNGPTDEDIAKAESQVDSATTALANARGDLSLAQKEWEARLNTAQDAVDTALEGYQGSFLKWLGVQPDEVGGDLEPDAQLDSLGADLESLFDPDSRFQDTLRGFLSEGPPPDDPGTPWSEFVVYAWMNLTPGYLVPTCEDIAVTPETQCVKKELDDAWDTLGSAADNLDTVKTQSQKAITNAEMAVTRAEESLVATEEALADLEAGHDPLEIESKEKQLAVALAALQQAEEDLSGLKTLPDAPNALEAEGGTLQTATSPDRDDQADGDPAALLGQRDALEIASQRKQIAVAQANLDKAGEDLDELMGGPDPLEVGAQRMQVTAAQANLDKADEDLAELMGEPNALEVEAQRKQVAVAVANLDIAEEELEVLMGGPDPLDVEAQRKQAAVAQASLDKAVDDLAELKGSVDPLEVALREADVDSARLALEAALQRWDGATLRAPMSGVVSLVNVEAGQAVNANTRVLEIVDPSVVEVDGIVDEIDVLFVQVGARADVTMDALAGEVLEGTVSSIASAAQNQQGVVTYPIRIEVQLPEDVELVEGLSATANIVIREEADVLLVPLQTIYGTFEQPLVRVMNNGRIEERAVALGNNDDFWVVVSRGLVEGEQVVMETAEATTDPFAALRQRFQAGGGGGGLGGFGGGQGRRNQP